jgi:hypothetical protein
LVPITFRLFPVEVFMQGIRTAFNTIHNKYLNYYNGWFPPDVLYLSDNYLVINKPFDVKVNSDKPTEYTVATQLKQHFPDLVDETCSHHFRYVPCVSYKTCSHHFKYVPCVSIKHVHVTLGMFFVYQ